MFDLVLFLVVLAPAPLLAIVVLAVRLRDAVRRGGAGTLAARFRAAWRNGTGRPVWAGLIAVAAGVAVLTVGLERSYLATVTNGPRWGFDVVLLTIVLGLLAAVVCAALAGLAAAAVGCPRIRGRNRRRAARPRRRRRRHCVRAPAAARRLPGGARQAERRRFAIGGAWAALRSGLPHGAWARAAGVAVVVAGGSLVA
jgi:hypothetical protein